MIAVGDIYKGIGNYAHIPFLIVLELRSEVTYCRWYNTKYSRWFTGAADTSSIIRCFKEIS